MLKPRTRFSLSMIFYSKKPFCSASLDNTFSFQSELPKAARFQLWHSDPGLYISIILYKTVITATISIKVHQCINKGRTSLFRQINIVYANSNESLQTTHSHIQLVQHKRTFIIIQCIERTISILLLLFSGIETIIILIYLEFSLGHFS